MACMCVCRPGSLSECGRLTLSFVVNRLLKMPCVVFLCACENQSILGAAVIF